jgi:hypothetical protein
MQVPSPQQDAKAKTVLTAEGGWLRNVPAGPVSIFSLVLANFQHILGLLSSKVVPQTCNAAQAKYYRRIHYRGGCFNDSEYDPSYRCFSRPGDGQNWRWGPLCRHRVHHCDAAEEDGCEDQPGTVARSIAGTERFIRAVAVSRSLVSAGSWRLDLYYGRPKINVFVNWGEGKSCTQGAMILRSPLPR